MKREELLAKGYTEEQVTDLLNTFHGINQENEKLKGELIEKATFETKFNEAQKKLEDIEKANMTEQEKYEQMKKETELNYKKSQIIVNKANAMQILAGLEIDEELIDSLVTENVDETTKRANLLKNKFASYKENVIKETKESITNLDAKPNPTNNPQNDNTMTFDKFRKLSQEEQNAFANEHPEEFAKL